MKLVIQIPCYNEQDDLPTTLAALPREVPGIDSVEVLVIDDGSTDDTVSVARRCGVRHVISNAGNQGLARTFMNGLEQSIALGADVVVNTDADNQYNADDIAELVAPIVSGRADIVVGARPIRSIEHFSPVKKVLQRIGSTVVRSLSGTRIADAPSGFRAFSRDAALRLNVFSRYTYTLETLIQAGHSNLRVVDVPIRINGPTRPSRLIRSIPTYVRRSILDLFATYVIYAPARLFGWLAALFLVPGAVLAARYVYFVAIGEGTGHVQSVIASGVLAVCGVFAVAIAVLAHLLAINRRLLEELRYLQRRGEVREGSESTP
ncbi:MAG: glycosyltransferase family 2 protein [Acidobacteria bacterium]|nr:MAG: glycosyltransferase family 2 protein [Acidobacteriota bacterium]REK06332.1 MAG: glycosyltransferase family 2 protein [Acidobacteriota bacterium]